MSSETTTETCPLDEVRAQIKKAAELAVEKRTEFRNQIEMAAVLVNSYNEQRLEMFKTELEKRKLTWCSRCGQLVLVDAAKLLHHSGAKRVRVGYDGYGTEPFSLIYRACQTCQAELTLIHGNFDRQVQKAEWVYPAEERAGEYYSEGIKIEVTLPLNLVKLKNIPDEFLAKFSKGMNIPPELKLDADGRISELW